MAQQGVVGGTQSLYSSRSLLGAKSSLCLAGVLLRPYSPQGLLRPLGRLARSDAGFKAAAPGPRPRRNATYAHALHMIPKPRPVGHGRSPSESWLVFLPFALQSRYAVVFIDTSGCSSEFDVYLACLRHKSCCCKHLQKPGGRLLVPKVP